MTGSAIIALQPICGIEAVAGPDTTRLPFVDPAAF